MKLLADQNVHRRVVLYLRELGYDVEFILETMPGRSDHEIFARPDIAKLIFITGDKGFGNWIFNQGLPCPLAILLSRLPHPDWKACAERLSTILVRGVSPGQMTIITKDGERKKPFPIGASNG